MAKIHPSSIVMDGAILGDGVEIGPLCYVGPNVKIGAGTRLISHCNVDGYTTLRNGTVAEEIAHFIGCFSSTTFVRSKSIRQSRAVSLQSAVNALQRQIVACVKSAYLVAGGYEFAQKNGIVAIAEALQRL